MKKINKYLDELKEIFKETQIEYREVIKFHDWGTIQRHVHKNIIIYQSAGGFDFDDLVKFIEWSKKNNIKPELIHNQDYLEFRIRMDKID